VAKSALDDATRTLSRLKRVAAAGGVSDQELERAALGVTARQSELDGARQRVSASKFDLESARAAVAPFTGGREALRITAPVGGLLLRLIEEHERVVAPGTPLAEVGDQRELEAVIPLLTSDAARVRDGAAVTLTFGEHGDTLRGHVIRVEPSAFTKVSALGVEEQRVNVIATAPGTGVHVGDQFRVHARVTVWEAARVLRIPASALVRDGERWFTFVVADGRAVRRPVAIGERGGELVEVREGVADGDRVVVYPGDRVTDGLRVRPRLMDSGAASRP
jgi:HlyD family secretion protein